MVEEFRKLLREWREKAGLDAADLDRALEKAGVEVPTRFTSQLENGRLRAPDRDVCTVFANVLGKDPDELWRLSMHERLRKADPGALDYHLEQVQLANALGHTVPEGYLVLQARSLAHLFDPQTAPNPLEASELSDNVVSWLGAALFRARQDPEVQRILGGSVTPETRKRFLAFVLARELEGGTLAGG